MIIVFLVVTLILSGLIYYIAGDVASDIIAVINFLKKNRGIEK